MVMIAGINLAVWAFLQSRHLGGLGERCACCDIDTVVTQHHGRLQDDKGRGAGRTLRMP